MRIEINEIILKNFTRGKIFLISSCVLKRFGVVSDFVCVRCYLDFWRYYHWVPVLLIKSAAQFQPISLTGCSEELPGAHFHHSLWPCSTLPVPPFPSHFFIQTWIYNVHTLLLVMWISSSFVEIKKNIFWEWSDRLLRSFCNLPLTCKWNLWWYKPCPISTLEPCRLRHLMWKAPIFLSTCPSFIVSLKIGKQA